MFRFLACGMAVLCMISGCQRTSTARSGANDLESTRVVLKQHVFHSQGMATHTMLVPDGWQTEGGAFAGFPGIDRILPSQKITITGPDGSQVRIGPSMAGRDLQLAYQSRTPELTVMDGYPIVYLPDSPQAWKTYFEQKVFPHEEDPAISSAGVVSVTRIDELNALLESVSTARRQMSRSTRQMGQQFGIQQNHFWDAVAIGIEYSKNGQTYEQLHVIALTGVTTQSSAGRDTIWRTEMDYSVSAPQGQLDARLPLLLAVAQSVRTTPDWLRAVERLRRGMARADLETVAMQSQLHGQTMNYISDLSQRGWTSRDGSGNASQNRLVDSIHEEEVYRNGDDQYLLPGHYDHVYGDGNGNFILTNDSLYDPGTDSSLDGNWSAADRVQ